MKKKIHILLLSMLILTLFCIAVTGVSASDSAVFEDTTGSGADNTETEVFELPEVNAGENVGNGDDTFDTLFSRLYEYYINNKSVVFDIAIGVILGFVSLLNKLKSDRMHNSILSVKGSTSITAASQKNVVDAVNNMVESHNDMRRAYEKNESLEDDRNRLLGAVMVQNTALTEMFVHAYANSKTLPQGVKDVIMTKYAKMEKMLGNDATLKAVVDSVRERLTELETEVTADDTSSVEEALRGETEAEDEELV